MFTKPSRSYLDNLSLHCIPTLTAAAAMFLWGIQSAQSEPVHHKVAAGLFNVTQIFGVDDNTNCVVTPVISINNFRSPSGNRADYNVTIGVGAEASDDSDRGILMTSVAQNGRDNFGTNGYPTSSTATNGSGGYRIVSFLGQDGVAGSSTEYNVNFAGACFPYADFIGGFGRNAASVNGGATDLFTGSPGLIYGIHFTNVTTGKFVVDLRTRGIDSRTNGILLVTHAKDENNFALSQVNTTNGTWNVFVRDNAQPTFGTYEQDPVAFVYIPKTNTTLVSGRFDGEGDIEMYSGLSPQFTVTTLAAGRWELKVTGITPTNGVLIISPEGGGSLNGDNIVSYQPNAANDGWEIQSRDTPNNGLQTPSNEAVASFVCVRAPTAGISVSPTNNISVTGDGGTATIGVVLHSQPSANVNINVASSDSLKAIATPATLTFTADNWHVPQNITLTGQNDLQTGIFDVILSPATSSDLAYNGINPADATAFYAPPRAFLVSPPNENMNTSRSPLLAVNVTNTIPGDLTVTFHAREATVSFPGDDFSIAILPDTQMYAGEKNGGTKEMFISQVEWIITNRLNFNIVYVTQLGDIVNDGDIFNGSPNLTQWRNATNAMYRQEDPVRTQLIQGIPYGVAVGNHEWEPIGDATGTTLFYNQYFGVNRFTGRHYYGGHFGTNNNNHYDIFSVGALDFVVLYIEYNTAMSQELLTWGNDILRTNAHRRAIVVTHSMGNTQTPLAFSAQGSTLYHTFKGNTNLFMMLGGHVTGEGSRQDTFNGNIVRTYVQDFQGWTNGGNGFMRLLTFSPSNNLATMQTFSPWTGEYKTDSVSEFSFPYNMQPEGIGSTGTVFTALSTNTGVAPGTQVTHAWSGLLPDKIYEWYVTITDQFGVSTASPVWRFKTSLVNTPPAATNTLRVIVGDSPTNLNLIATDINGDPITFLMPTSPNRGLIQNFNPTNGAFTYTPARGYRGTDQFTFRANDGLASSFAASMNFNIVAPPDSNSNGLPDSWETLYGVSNPSADDDGDGRSNLEEYTANTNPTNAASVFRILDAERETNGHFRLTWPSVGGTRYRIEYSNSNTNSGITVFNDIVRNIATEMDSNTFGLTTTQTFTDTFTVTPPPTNGARYYRVKVVP